MKRTKKLALLISGALILLGIILSVTAIAMNGFTVMNFNSVSFTDKTYYAEGTFSAININDVNNDIMIKIAEDGECRVTCQEAEKIYHTVRIENDTLSVERVDIRPWYERFGVTSLSNGTVTVYLPEKEYAQLTASAVSGEIWVDEGCRIQKVLLSSVSDDLHFSGDAAKLQCKTTSGEVFLRNLTDTKITVHSVTGNLTLTDSTPAALTAESTNGEIEINNTDISGELKLSTVNGDISLADMDADTIEIETVSGEISGTILSPKHFAVDTVSGDVSLPDSVASAKGCTIYTTNGDVSLSLTKSN